MKPLPPAAGDARYRVLSLLAMHYGLSVTCALSVSSLWLAHVTGVPVLWPADQNAIAFVLPVLLLATFWWLYRCEFPANVLIPPTDLQLGVGVAFLGAALFLAYAATHPSNAQLDAAFALAGRSPLLGQTLITELLRVALVLPAIPLALLVFGMPFLRRFAAAFWLMLGILLAVLLAGVPDALYYESAIPGILRLTGDILGWIGVHAEIDASARMVRLGAFQSNIGPSCVGSALFILFGGFIGLLAWRLRTRPGFSAVRMVIAGASGLLLLFILNVLRIAAIIVIGSLAPALGELLFHSIAGTLVIVGVCLLFERAMLPWIVRGRR
jgi:exosortase/archaeosortase family protein